MRPVVGKSYISRSRFVVGLLLIGLPACSSQSVDDVWTEATEAFAARDFPKVEASMARLAKLRTPTTDDHMMLAQLAMAHEQTDRALSYLDKIPDSHPMAAQARLQAGQLELRRHRALAAERFFLQSLALKPDMVSATKELIYIYGMQLRRPELHARFRALARTEALTSEQVFLWCLTRGSAWEPLEVSQILGRYVEADPDDRWSRIGLVEALRNLNRYEEADAALAPLKDDDPEVITARARLALDRGDDAKAEALLSTSPRDHLALALLRGRLALARRNDQAAVEAFRDAVKVDPNHRDAVFGLAHSLQRVGDPEAKAYLDLSLNHERLGTLVQRVAVPKSRRDPELLRDLGAACAAIGRYPEARAWYALAIKINPLDSEAQRGLFHVNEKESAASAPKPTR